MANTQATHSSGILGGQIFSLETLATLDWRLAESSRPLSLAEQIAEQISRDVLKGVHKPGERLVEQTIANNFQVSRGPVRDAIRILEREGVVEILPRRGTQVTLLSIKEMNNIYAIRGALIALGVMLAAPLLSAEDLGQIRNWIDELAHVCSENRTAEDYVPISYHVTLFIIKKCQNERLYDMVRSMSRQTLRYSLLGLSSPERCKQSVDIWNDLADALEARNGKHAAEFSRRLIEEGGRAARDHLQATENL